MKVAEAPTIKMLLLESVAHILSTDMEEVFMLVLRWLLVLGFVNIKWGTMEASSVGSPQSRRRWYCLAQKADADTARLKRLLPVDTKAISKCVGEPWNA